MLKNDRSIKMKFWIKTYPLLLPSLKNSSPYNSFNIICASSIEISPDLSSSYKLNTKSANYLFNHKQTVMLCSSKVCGNSVIQLKKGIRIFHLPRSFSSIVHKSQISNTNPSNLTPRLKEDNILLAKSLFSTFK